MQTDSSWSPSRSGQSGVDGLVPAGGSGAVSWSHGQTIQDGAAIGSPG